MTFGKEQVLSFEFFPPRNTKEFDLLKESCISLAPYSPNFISFTDGAGGSKNRDIIDAVKIVRQHLDTEVVAHITSCDKQKVDVDKIINAYLEESINSFLIIRGDCPTNEFLIDLDELENEINTEFKHSSDLIEYINTKNIKRIGFGAFPSGHPEDKNREQTLSTFKKKVEAGGSFSATQIFFDIEEYKNLYKEIRQFDATTPIYAGIMPLVSLIQAERFAEVCDTELPSKLREGFLDCKSKEEERDFGLSYISDLCDSLIENDADGLHFYTLNRSRPFIEIESRMKMVNFSNTSELSE